MIAPAPLLMLTLPNSGSTWFAELIAQHTRYDRYRMEFFNPIRSPQHYMMLRRQFGCELADCYSNIAEPGDELIDEEIRSAWGAENLNFTKEVFSPYKLASFTRHFRCFVLLREAADTFPPKRVRVWSFYEHAWFALCRAGLAKEGNAMHFEERARQAHRIMSEAIRADAATLAVPIVEYRDLFEDKGLPARLQERRRCLADRRLEAISQQRRLPER